MICRRGTIYMPRLCSRILRHQSTGKSFGKLPPAFSDQTAITTPTQVHLTFAYLHSVSITTSKLLLQLVQVYWAQMAFQKHKLNISWHVLNSKQVKHKTNSLLRCFTSVPSKQVLKASVVSVIHIRVPKD